MVIGPPPEHLEPWMDSFEGNARNIIYFITGLDMGTRHNNDIFKEIESW